MAILVLEGGHYDIVPIEFPPFLKPQAPSPNSPGISQRATGSSETGNRTKVRVSPIVD